MKDMITIQNLTKTYGKHRGVEDVAYGDTQWPLLRP